MTELEPKILIVSRAFDAGDAITTINLFSKWPKHKLFCATPIQTPFAQDFGSCYFLGDKECKAIRPLNLFERIPHSGIQKVNRIDIINRSFSFKRKVYKRWIMPTLKYLDLYDERFQVNLSDDFCKWVELIRPDIVYSSVGDISIAKFLIEFNARFPEIKLAIHGFDDWITPSYKILRSKNHVNKASALLSSLISKAVFLLSTTEMMAREYEKRYGRKFHTFHNPVDLSSKYMDEFFFEGKCIHLTYIGKIAWHNAEALRNMVEAIKEYNQGRGDDKVMLDIYTATSQLTLESFGIKGSGNLIIHSPIPNIKIPSLLKASDCLFLPITISEDARAFAKFSMSTKMGEYLASGTPVIYCGPKGIAMTELVEQNQVALYTTENGKKPLIDLVRIFVENKSVIVENSLRGKELAKKLFDKELVSESFLSYFVCLNS